MQFKDEAKWDAGFAKNSDFYGRGIYTYAKRWAELMEANIANGGTVSSCAKQASHQADIDGITGFMYGAAASILSECWIYGDQLRRWHNKDIDPVHGDEVTDKGGTLNPALLTVRIP